VKAQVDRDCCILSGLCTSIAPETFSLDDDGELVVAPGEVAPEYEDDVQVAVDTCPVGALSTSP
jgi:ferredoxin